MTGATSAAGRPRRSRGAAETLGAIVLATESIVVFLAGLVIYGLRALPDPIAPWWGIVAGSTLALAMVAVAGLLRHRWAVVLGWTLQVVVLLGGLLVPGIVVVGLIFGGLWAYATIKGAELDRRNARRAAETQPPDGE